MIRPIFAAAAIALAVLVPGSPSVTHNKTFLIEFPHSSVVGHCHTATVAQVGSRTEYIGSRCLPRGRQAPAQLTSTVPKSTCAPPYVRCFVMPNSSSNVNGVEIVTNASGGNPGTPLIVMDHNHAPMAWVNLYGLFSGGDWGKMPGGLICVTNGVMAEAACLTPVGTLQLWTQDGQVQTLTPADIAWIHQQEAAQKAGR